MVKAAMEVVAFVDSDDVPMKSEPPWEERNQFFSPAEAFWSVRVRRGRVPETCRSEIGVEVPIPMRPETPPLTKEELAKMVMVEVGVIGVPAEAKNGTWPAEPALTSGVVQ